METEPLPGTAWHCWALAELVVTASRVCVCSPLGRRGARQMVAEMSPNPVSAGHARGVTPKVTTPLGRVSVVPCLGRGEPSEATREPSKQTEGIPGARPGWGVGVGDAGPGLPDPILRRLVFLNPFEPGRGEEPWSGGASEGAGW